MRDFDWNDEKNEFLKSARGVSFEEVVFHIQNGDVLTCLSIPPRLNHRPHHLCLSEIMTLVIAFHTLHYRDCKAFYSLEVQGHWLAEFPSVVSYSRFVDFQPSTLAPLCAYLRHCSGS